MVSTGNSGICDTSVHHIYIYIYQVYTFIGVWFYARWPMPQNMIGLCVYVCVCKHSCTYLSSLAEKRFSTCHFHERFRSAYLMVSWGHIFHMWSRIKAWTSNYISSFRWHVITHPCPNFNGALAKPPLKLGHVWVMTLHRFKLCNYLSQPSRVNKSVPNFNGAQVKPSLKLGHEWAVISHNRMCM